MVSCNPNTFHFAHNLTFGERNFVEGWTLRGELPSRPEGKTLQNATRQSGRCPKSQQSTELFWHCRPLDVPHVDVSSDSDFCDSFLLYRNMALVFRSLYTWSILKGTCKWSSYLITCSASHYPAVTFDGFFSWNGPWFLLDFLGVGEIVSPPRSHDTITILITFFNWYMPGMREWSQQVFQSGMSSHQL